MSADDRQPCVLTIAGTDPLVGAGAYADLRVFEVFASPGLVIETAFVEQDSHGVRGYELASVRSFADRLRLVRDDCKISAIKIGMTASPAILAALEEVLSEWSSPPPIVFDPVLVSGGREASQLYEGEYVERVRALFPYLTLITPNARELGVLTGVDVHRLADAIEGATRLHRAGAQAVLIKGGHLEQRGRDFLSVIGDAVHPVFRGEEWGVDLHGTGCHLSSAITALLASGEELLPACQRATRWLHRLVALGAYHQIGRGRPQFDPRRLREGLASPRL